LSFGDFGHHGRSLARRFCALAEPIALGASFRRFYASCILLAAARPLGSKVFGICNAAFS
jgi:hypothetical protein